MFEYNMQFLAHVKTFDVCHLYHVFILKLIIYFSNAFKRLSSYHIISYIIRTNVLEHTRHTSALTVAQKHNETFQRNSTELKS